MSDRRDWPSVLDQVYRIECRDRYRTGARWEPSSWDSHPMLSWFDGIDVAVQTLLRHGSYAMDYRIIGYDQKPFVAATIERTNFPVGIALESGEKGDLIEVQLNLKSEVPSG